MKVKHPRTVKDLKGKVAIAELQRAHWIITVLALALAFLVVVAVVQPLQFDMILGTIAVVLLVLVAVVSAGIALYIGKK